MLRILTIQADIELNIIMKWNIPITGSLHSLSDIYQAFCLSNRSIEVSLDLSKDR